jgi:hypothetical protein
MRKASANFQKPVVSIPLKPRFSIQFFGYAIRAYSGRNSRSELRSPAKSPGNTEVPSFKVGQWGLEPQVSAMLKGSDYKLATA